MTIVLSSVVDDSLGACACACLVHVCVFVEMWECQIAYNFASNNNGCRLSKKVGQQSAPRVLNKLPTVAPISVV